MSSSLFTAFCLRSPSDEQVSRVGLTVPRKLGKAVRRNRIKRRLREALRHRFALLPPGWMLVLNPRGTAADAPFPRLLEEVERLFQRCARSS